MIIRKADESDFPKLVEILQASASIEELVGFVSPEVLESRSRGISAKFLSELRSQFRRREHGVIVAEKDEKSVGFAYFRFQRDYIGIEEMDVRKEYQQKGVGKSLLRCIEQIAREKGVSHLKTGTSVNREGKPWKAYGFWIHMGFSDTGKRTESEGIEYAELIKPL